MKNSNLISCPPIILLKELRPFCKVCSVSSFIRSICFGDVGLIVIWPFPLKMYRCYKLFYQIRIGIFSLSICDLF